MGKVERFKDAVNPHLVLANAVARLSEGTTRGVVVLELPADGNEHAQASWSDMTRAQLCFLKVLFDDAVRREVAG